MSSILIEATKFGGVMNTDTGFIESVEILSKLTAEDRKKYTKLTEDEHQHIKDLEQAKRPDSLKRYRYERRRKNREAKHSRAKNR